MLALAFFAVLATPGVAFGATGSISGTVTAASGGAPLPGIEVCAWEVPSEGLACTATDASGDYAISALPVGNYKVEFWPGSTGHYIVQFYNSKSSWQEAELVAVTSGADSPGINAALNAGGQITGTVTDATSGAGIQSSTVCAVEATTGEIWSCALTHNNGQYTLGGLPSGSYKAWFSPDVPEWEEEDDYFQQFYNGKPTFAQATAIPVAAPGVVSGIDARLVSRKVIPPPPVVTVPAAPVVPPVAAVPKPKPKLKHCSKGQKSVTRKGKKRCVKVHRQHRHGRHSDAKRMALRLPPLLP